MRKLGKPEKRWSYASWTSPSHFNMLTGLLPHESPKKVYASDYYRRDFVKFNERLGGEGIRFESLIPRLYLPPFLKSLGYKTHARVSLPVLNPNTILNDGFDTYKLMDAHNDFNAILREVHFSEEYPSFYLLNVGETHYPYALEHFQCRETEGIARAAGGCSEVSGQGDGRTLRHGTQEHLHHHHL